MEKTITRTVTTYKHIFATYNKKDDGSYEMADVKEYLLDAKLGARSAIKFAKENGISEYNLVAVEPVNEKYAIPVSVFMEHAVKVEA